MTHPLQSAIRARLLAVADERDIKITVADVEALTEAALVAALSAPVPEAPIKLTNQQLGVLIGIARGDTERATARRMCLTESTVKTHRRRLYSVLGAGTAAEAVAIAMSYGLLRPSRSARFALPGQRDRRTL
ncbi:response regulator transcription factor [Streptomyces sp. NBC_00842]|uniref:response regulator transcription factor n=1 Tax=Streptomyces sp. NBC_00842 TaxID=2975848 RepID=UPI0038681780|nr:LuxR C-terminal-related transcriptional regulator [Streptomyces sp. NBC_00842]